MAEVPFRYIEAAEPVRLAMDSPLLGVDERSPDRRWDEEDRKEDRREPPIGVSQKHCLNGHFGNTQEKN